MKKWPLVLILLMADLSFLSSTPPASADSSIPSSFFGFSVNAIGANPWPGIPIATLGKIPGTSWQYVESTNGSFTWKGLDDAINIARSNGVNTFLYAFYSTPSWAATNPTQTCYGKQTGCSSPPTKIQYWNEYVTAVVTRYKGQIRYYEMWNEPNYGGSWTGGIPLLVNMTASAYAIVKSIDPNAIVLTPSVSIGGIEPSPSWLLQYLQAGGSKYADGVTWHGYSCQEGQTYGGYGCVNGIGCSLSSSQLDCAGVPLVAQVEAVKSIMSQTGLSGRPLIDTEGGWGTLVLNADQQAAYVSRWYIIQASQGVTGAVWWLWGNGGIVGYGVANPTIYSSTTAAFTQTYDWLVGATMTGSCSISNSIWSCGLTRPSGYRGLILWSNTSQTYTYTPPSSYASYRELNGTTFSIHGTIPIGILPVLLESTSSSISSTSTTTATSTSSSSTSSRVPEFPGASLLIALIVITSVVAFGIRVGMRNRIRLNN